MLLQDPTFPDGASLVDGGAAAAADAIQCHTHVEFGLIIALLALTAGYIYQEIHQAITSGCV